MEVLARSLTRDGLRVGIAISRGERRYGSYPPIAFDGSSFLVAFRNPDAKLVTVRIQNGLAEPAGPLPVEDDPTFVGVPSDDKACLLFWKSAARQVQGPPLPPLLLGPSHPGSGISLGRA